jgi:hypothetical protein
LDEKRIAALMQHDKEGLITKQPKEVIKMKVFDPKTQEWAPSFAKNCCYLVKHKHAFDALWHQKHASTDVLENAEGGANGDDSNALYDSN